MVVVGARLSHGVQRGLSRQTMSSREARCETAGGQSQTLQIVALTEKKREEKEEKEKRREENKEKKR